ncbi:uncharacterized protein PFL1_06146 [Pseudozyma flocculosa PF-1]|uniref:Uncharacterized protein n=2 Tax=Pseudozyma flocculosa TaxID=84751 RepID=A0A5C3F7Y9_9BASI|nr:uncharacterized protein PFL1_06146 [Pseudozyma flocculosa PF-1]EPQ26211.1 hypothetical protein PFL1_06146 [Pseudozyma flocculosa PF-1]SPO40166.1 uncharacterized protein PSFLO_05648 [Pseudozyma flocculosa]
MAYRELHQRFNLPDPPARSVWAFGRPHIWQRAWFPDFDAAAAAATTTTATTVVTPVDQLSRFIHRLLQPDIGHSACTQLKVLSGVATLLVLMSVMILVRRFHQRSLWLFRVQQRSNGTLIVPNAVANLTWVLMFYFGTMVGFVWYAQAWSTMGLRSDHFSLWMSMPWIPLCLGAYLYVLGVALARPDSLKSISRDPGRPPSLALRLGITPRVVNVIFFVIPLVPAAALVAPVHRAERRWQTALDQKDAWNRRWAAETALNREMLLEAQTIWNGTLSSASHLCIAYAIWAATGFALFAGVLICAGRLALTIRSQMKTMRSFKANQSFSESFAVQRRKASAQLGAGKGAAVPGGKLRHGLQKHGDAPIARLLLAVHRQWQRRFGDDAESVSGGDDDSGGDEEQAESMFFSAAQLEQQDAPVASFFPAVKPSTFHRPPKVTARNGRRAQRYYLERCLSDLMVQLVGISVAAFLYSVLGVYVAVQWYPSWEANEGGRVLTLSASWVAYVCVICGAWVFLMIFGRTYEPVVNNIVAASQERVRPVIRRSMAADPSTCDDAAARSGTKLTWAKSAVGRRSGLSAKPEGSKAVAGPRVSLQVMSAGAASTLVAAGGAESFGGSAVETVFEASHEGGACGQALGKKGSDGDLGHATAEEQVYTVSRRDAEDAGSADDKRAVGHGLTTPGGGILVTETVTRQYEDIGATVVCEVNVVQRPSVPLPIHPSSPTAARGVSINLAPRPNPDWD